MGAARIAEAFERQADFCRTMGSAFYGTLMSEVAQSCRRDAQLHALLSPYESVPFVPLRFAAMLHRWALDGSAPEITTHFPSTGGDGDACAAWKASRPLLHDRIESFAKGMRDVPQTNEVGRATPLLAGFLLAAHRLRLPLRIFEIGASAGLNLRFDSYAYRGSDWQWGSPNASLVLLNYGSTGSPAHTAVQPQIVERRGCDLHPLDCENDADCERLVSFVWPDQHERLARLRRALGIAQQVPVAIDRADAVEWLGDVARPVRGALTLVMHSVVVEYLTDGARSALDAQIAQLAAMSSSVAPFGWLRMEHETSSFETRLRLWPLEEEWLVARSDGHAQRIEWCNALQ